MKTKFVMAIPTINVEIEGTQINIPTVHIEAEVEVSVGELKGMYDLQKTVLAESPYLIGKFVEDVAHEIVLRKDSIKKELMKDEDFARDIEFSDLISKHRHETIMKEVQKDVE